MNVKNIGYSHPMHTAKGYNVMVNYAGKKPITIETGEMLCPYGIDKAKNGVYTMKLVPMKDNTILDLLTEIDERNINLPDEYKWFGEDDTDTQEPFYFSPHLSDQNAMRVRIPLKNGKRFDVNIICNSNDLACMDNIIPGCKVKCVLEWKHIWIIDHTFGYFWTVKDIYLMDS